MPLRVVEIVVIVSERPSTDYIVVSLSSVATLFAIPEFLVIGLRGSGTSLFSVAVACPWPHPRMTGHNHQSVR